MDIMEGEGSLNSFIEEFNKIHSVIFNGNEYKALFLNEFITKTGNTDELCKSLEDLWLRIRLSGNTKDIHSPGKSLMYVYDYFSIRLLAIPAYLSILFEVVGNQYPRKDVLAAVKVNLIILALELFV